MPLINGLVSLLFKQIADPGLIFYKSNYDVASTVQENKLYLRRILIIIDGHF